jgi:hypothetical protein
LSRVLNPNAPQTIMINPITIRTKPAVLFTLVRVHVKGRARGILAPASG